MTSQVVIEYADGDAAAFATEPDQTIVESADRAEIPLSFSCLSGICRACAAQDARTGELVLLCQVRKDEDAKYVVPYSRAAASIRPSKRRAKLERYEKVAQSVYHLTYRLEFPVTYLPGQYASIAVPAVSSDQPRKWRYFSMSSDPSDGTRLSFYVRDIPGGHLGTYLAQRARHEDLTTIEAPRGAFYLRDDKEPTLFVGGGTGLSPMLSMLKALARVAPDSEATLVFGVTDAEDIFALDEIKSCRASLPNLKIVYTVMNGVAGAVSQINGTVVDGLSHPNLSGRLERVQNAYLCGPPVMVDAARAALEPRMKGGSTIHNEVFSATDAL